MPLLRRTKRSASAFDDPVPVAPTHVTTFTQMLRDPRRYTQRCVEELGFLPGGGQEWIRSLQVLVPGSAKPDGIAWRIISLGAFRRRRFPDFAVHDAAGIRLNLLTRHQHGTVLARSFLARHFHDLPNAFERLQGSNLGDPSRATYAQLHQAIYTMFTTIDSTSRAFTEASSSAARAYITLLRQLKVTPFEATTRVSAFLAEFRQTRRCTEYLCWVKTAPGDVLNLRVTHTNKDVLHELAPLKGISDGLASIWRGLAEPRYKRRAVHDNWYVQYGLAPLKYRLAIPSHERAGSYYFTATPPTRSYIAYLDWETENSFLDDLEADSAAHAMHIHHDERLPVQSTRATAEHIKGDRKKEQEAEPVEDVEHGRTIRAYIRCAPNEHKKIAAGALLNLIFVFLVAYGHLTGDGTQTWLLVTPTVLTAYLAQQQRHYYAHTTRRQRAILWGYLGTSIAFLVTISFNKIALVSGSAKWGPFTVFVAWLLAASSAAVFVWYAPIGYGFQRVTERRTRRLMAEQARDEDGATPSWGLYERVIHQYCDRIIRGVAAGIVVVTVLAGATWNLSRLVGDHDKTKGVHSGKTKSLTHATQPHAAAGERLTTPLAPAQAGH
jgi:hypothetical protein